MQKTIMTRVYWAILISEAPFLVFYLYAQWIPVTTLKVAPWLSLFYMWESKHRKNRLLVWDHVAKMEAVWLQSLGSNYKDEDVWDSGWIQLTFSLFAVLYWLFSMSSLFLLPLPFFGSITLGVGEFGSIILQKYSMSKPHFSAYEIKSGYVFYFVG